MRDAIERKFDSGWVGETRDAILAHGVEPTWIMLDSDSPEESRHWSSSAAGFVLFTHLFDKSSPLVELDSYSPVAIISLPLNERERDQIYNWTLGYRHIDQIWMGGDRMAIHAYQEMANVTSELSTEGRAICELIEKATCKPTYYFLMKYWVSPSESKALFCSDDDLSEPGRLCPGCGKHWRRRKLEASFLSRHEWYDFAYRCDDCRLVSNEARERGRKRQWRHGEGSPRVQASSDLKETIHE
jgi:predicted  nucleic acid-binding Zn ribbon protein